MERIGDAADVAAVAEGEDGEERDARVLGGVERAQEVLPLAAQSLFDGPRRGPPEPHGLVHHGRQVERRLIERLPAVDALALEAHHPLGDLDAAEPALERAVRALLQDLQDLRLLLRQRRREVVEVRGRGDHPPLLPLQGLHQELPAGVEVDGPRMAFVEHTHAVYRADRPAVGDDGEGHARSPQVHGALGPAAEGEDLVPLGRGQQVPLAQQGIDPRACGARCRRGPRPESGISAAAQTRWARDTGSFTGSTTSRSQGRSRNCSG